MPIIKSAEKRMRQTQVRRTRNVAYKKAVRTETKLVKTSLAQKELKQAADALKRAISQIDRSVKKGVMHKNTGARKKSRLTQQYNQLAKTPFGAEKPAKTAVKAAKKPAAKTKRAAPKPAVKKPAPAKTTTKKATPKKTSK